MSDPCSNPFAADSYAQRQLIAASVRFPHLLDELDLIGDFFTDSDCRRIFEVANTQHARGDAFDEFIIAHHLEAPQRKVLANAIEEQGDQSLLSSYAKLLKTKWQLRNYQAIGAGMMAAAGSASEDPATLIDEAHKRLDELQDTGARQRTVSAGEASFRVEKKALEAKRNGIPPGLRTGIAALDDILLPMREGQLIIEAGATSMGKTSLATHTAINLAKQGVPVSYFSLEMSAEDLGARLLAGETGIPVGEITSGRLSEDEFRRIQKATQSIEAWPLTIEASPALDVGQLMRRGRQHKRKFGTQLVIVDYLQLMSGKGHSFYEQVCSITRGLKTAAGELGIPVIALSQLNREVERRSDGNYENRYLKRRPKLSDLRDSGSIEQDADVVIFLHREEVYLSREKPPLNDDSYQEWSKALNRHAGKADLIIPKQRQGKAGIATVAYDAVGFRFGEVRS